MMQNAIVNHDSESTSSSKSRNASINTISAFSEGSLVPIYRYILIIFFIVLIICLSANLVTYLTTGLSWDNTKLDRNPINDTLNLLKISHSSVDYLLYL